MASKRKIIASEKGDKDKMKWLATLPEITRPI